MDTSNESFGDFDDAIFFGLEEIDGSAFVSNNQFGAGSSDSSDKKNKKRRVEGEATTEDAEMEPAKKPQKDKKKANILRVMDAEPKVEPIKFSTLNEQALEAVHCDVDSVTDWGDVQLRTVLVTILSQKGFAQPTPIQSSAIPKILQCAADVIGVAETGSGKTLVS